jgi:hypothetical protein
MKDVKTKKDPNLFDVVSGKISAADYKDITEFTRNDRKNNPEYHANPEGHDNLGNKI